MCYTEDKLEHKTKILTEKWRKENGIDYATYANEKQYKSPTEVTDENLRRLKQLKKRLENLTSKGQKLAIRH